MGRTARRRDQGAASLLEDRCDILAAVLPMTPPYTGRVAFTLPHGRVNTVFAAPAGLRLVYSAPKAPGLRQVPAARPAGKGKGGRKVVAKKGKGKVAKVAAPRRRKVADEWDW